MNFMRIFLIFFCLLLAPSAYAQPDTSVSGPDGQLVLTFDVINGQPTFSVTHKNKIMIMDSPLGLLTNEGDFSNDMRFVEASYGFIDKSYSESKIKRTNVRYQANTMTVTLANAQAKEISIHFQLSNNDIAFRYELPAWQETLAVVVHEETTGFTFPSSTKAFLSPMMEPMTAYARTAPSYESGYVADEILENTTAAYGYVFPGLFRIGDDGWVLLSETGVGSNYCGSHLSPFQNGRYTIAYPDPGQNNGFDSNGAQLGLPGTTPWRTITVGETIQPIVETTIMWDVVDPLYEPSISYEFGRGTWSWIIWQDESMNYQDQVTYIELAATMGYEFILIDAWWDANIGYERMEELVEFARSKGVGVFLWYNSNGSFNDAPQTPKNRMHTAIARKQEMAWLRNIGVKGIKVDFLGGDKQSTMRLYEDILSDANDYGLQVIFHGSTLPRGWERMYPNFAGSEAVLASEMLVFSQEVRDQEAFFATLHPFIRNSVGSMDFGGVVLNNFINRGNQDGQKRLTTDTFQLATGILFQNPVQMFALTPNNLHDKPEFMLDFMREIPTTWDETIFIDGYPGKYVVLARRKGEKWYVAGVNAESTIRSISLDLPMPTGIELVLYNDDGHGVASMERLNMPTHGTVTIQAQPSGGFILINE